MNSFLPWIIAALSLSKKNSFRGNTVYENFSHFPLPKKSSFRGNCTGKYGTSCDNFDSLLLSLVSYTFRSKNSRRGRHLLKPSKMLVPIVPWFLLKPKRMPISWHAFCPMKASQQPPFTEIVSNVKGQAHRIFSQILFPQKNSMNSIFPSISHYFHIPKILLNFFPHTGKNRNRRKSNLLP